MQYSDSLSGVVCRSFCLLIALALYIVGYIISHHIPASYTEWAFFPTRLSIIRSRLYLYITRLLIYMLCLLRVPLSADCLFGVLLLWLICLHLMCLLQCSLAEKATLLVWFTLLCVKLYITKNYEQQLMLHFCKFDAWIHGIFTLLLLYYFLKMKYLPVYSVPHWWFLYHRMLNIIFNSYSFLFLGCLRMNTFICLCCYPFTQN